jgi:hypothetical protein
MTAAHTTTNASRMPRLVSSAASPIGRNPAMAADATPTIQVTRVGTCRVGWVFANHLGSSSSRDIENHTRVTPSMNVNSSAANRSTRWPSPVPGAPSIQAGRSAPISPTRKLK